MLIFLIYLVVILLLTMTVKEVADKLNKSQQFVRIGLQRGLLPFGFAIKMSSKYTYCISKKKFEELFN